MTIDIWTIREGHLVFKYVLEYNFTNREHMLVIRRKGKTDYIPTIDIRRITVEEDEKGRGENKPHYRRH